MLPGFGWLFKQEGGRKKKDQWIQKRKQKSENGKTL